MYPVYRDMNAYPYQTPFAPLNFPGWEAFRPQMKDDGANTRPVSEYWPSNYGYPAPMPCQNCCAHGQQPSYYNFRPPCPHFPTPPSYGQYYGGYPATYPQSYPYPYVPPPNYSMEMPRYEFDKGSPKAFHCCECPNHSSHMKSASNVKIEEQDPDVETKRCAPLIPAGLSGSPHSLMWAPAGYIMNNKEQPRQAVEGGNLDEPQVLSNVGNPSSNIQPGEQDPYVRYQWLPLDMNSIKRLMEGGELMKPQEKKASDVENKEQNKQFPYPIIWMPYGGQGGDQTRGQEDKNIGKSPAAEVKEKNKGKLPVEERPPTFKLLKHPDEEPLKEKIVSGDDANGAGTSGSRKTGIVKIIPVKQLDDHVPKSEKKEQESVKNGTDMKPSSPTKKSKLPPICLRVDPPRKKNGKGSSRSPSPPAEKRHQVSSGVKEQVQEVVGNDPKENVVVASHVTKEEKGSCNQERQSEAEDKMVDISDSSNLNATVSEDNAIHAQESQGVKESEHKDSDAPGKKILSETEAAVILQSAYRGYAVRRWEPLTKLRDIANVKEEAKKVSERIEKLELESCVTLAGKDKVAIGEIIMNLLLKLDAIQGLHPSVRDVRKSVAKELIRLQEKLDSIVSQVSIPAGPPSPTTTVFEKEPNVSSSDEESAGSLEITSEASKTSELGEKEGEEAGVSEVPLSQSLESQVTNKGELGSESHSEDTSGQFRNEDQDRNLDAEAPQENVEDDILRMEWECDLGAVKIDREETQVAEASEEIEEQLKFVDISCPMEKCDEDVASALAMEKMAEEHGEVIVENDTDPEDTPAQADTRTCYEDPDENLNEAPQESLEKVEDDICRMDWECDMGGAKFTPAMDGEETQPLESSRGPEKQASVVENLERQDQVDQLSGESQVQSDDINAVVPENHIIAESCDVKNAATREYDTTIGNLDMDAQESEIPGGSMEVPIVDQVQPVPVIEVEKQMITALPVSEGIKEESSPNLSTCPPATQQYEEQINRDEMSRRIIEENEKLRSMVEQLLASGKDQQNVISTLTAKVNALEKKLPKRRNKSRSAKRPRVVLNRNAS